MLKPVREADSPISEPGETGELMFMDRSLAMKTQREDRQDASHTSCFLLSIYK